MRSAKSITWLLAVLVAASAARAADTKPAEELAQLKKDLQKAYLEFLGSERNPATTEADRKAADDLYDQQAVALGRRAQALAEAYPDAPEAPEALVWIDNTIGFSAEATAVRDAAYDLMARRYLDSEAILFAVKAAWNRAGMSNRAEAFLLAAVERSANAKVRALACFSLGKYQHRLIDIARDLDSPNRGPSITERLGPERVRQIRGRRPEDLTRQAEAFYERTIREYGDLQPMGKVFPPLGEQARGELFKLRHLEPGGILAEIEGEDIDGRPMKLSDLRGKVILISFWASWCAPCMGMVPAEKALVEQMRGRPFVLVGVNGDDDRSRAKEAAAKNGISWRSFWDGGSKQGIAIRWGVSTWPTIYLVDAKGVIRERSEGPRGAELDKAVADLVAEAESAGKRP